MFLKKAFIFYTEQGIAKFFETVIDLLKYRYKMRYGYFIHRTAIVKKRKLIKIGKHAEILNHVIIKTFKQPVVIGDNTQINPYTVIYNLSGVYIGNNVMIAPHCMIASGNHNYKQLEKPMRFAEDFSKGPIIIEDGVWIGANSTIIDGVTIGHNAVISANCVVTKNVLPFDIVGGVPAKVLSNRIEIALNKTLTEEEKMKYAIIYKNVTGEMI